VRVQVPHEEQRSSSRRSNTQSSKWKNFQRWIGKWKKRIEEAEVTEEGMCGSRTPERNRESRKKEWQKCLRNKCWRHNKRRHSQVGIPE